MENHLFQSKWAKDNAGEDDSPFRKKHQPTVSVAAALVKGVIRVNAPLCIFHLHRKWETRALLITAMRKDTARHLPRRPKTFFPKDRKRNTSVNLFSTFPRCIVVTWVELSGFMFDKVLKTRDCSTCLRNKFIPLSKKGRFFR